MANKPFDGEVINNAERPLSSDVNMVQSYAALGVRALMQSMFTKRSSPSNDAGAIFPGTLGGAFFGSAFKARQIGSGTLFLTLDAGLGVYNTGTSDTSVGGVSGVNDISFLKPLVLTPAAAEVSSGIGPIPQNVSGNTRLDIIEVAVNRVLTDATSRDVLNSVTGAFDPDTVDKTLSYALDNTATVNGSGAINYKTGTPSGSPAPPAVDAGYVQVALIRVPTGTTSAITNSMISDWRQLMVPYGGLRVQGHCLAQGTPGTAPGISGLCAPPGVQVNAIVTRSGSNVSQLAIYVIGGFGLGFSGGMSAVIGGGVDNTAGPIFLDSTELEQVSSVGGLQAALASATASAIPMSVGADQWIWEADIIPDVATGGGMFFDFDITLQY